jgi:glyoxylase-like metal-dependent hydrolase (beta-lactamase superfamily II)
MKDLIKLSMTMMAISISGCSTLPSRAVAYQGRVIEFKSGAEGFDTRTFFYEGEQEVIAFDSQFTPGLAQQSIYHLRKYTDKPITWLVVTHPNPDKFNGAPVFQAQGARVISSKATAEAMPGVHAYKEYFFVEMAKMFKKGEYPQLPTIDQTFEGETDLVLRGGERIQLRELAHPGVSSTQTVAYIQSVQALMVGDLVHHKAHVWLEGGIVNGKATPTLVGWIQDLKELESLYPREAQVYGGRGISAELGNVIPEQVTYLKKAQALVKKDLKARGAGVSEYSGANSAVLYKDLAAKFQTAFPDYELSYLIEYGAYGLVQDQIQKLK